MTPERWAQLEPLFEVLISLAPAQRAEFLSRCPDPAVRADLEKLRSEYENLGSFFDPPPQPQADETESITQDVLSPGEVLKKRYRILRMLGRGGMGEVYEAEDSELNCRIALKTLRTGLPAAGAALARFKREILLGRRVTHLNVCRVYDIDRVDRAGKGEVVFLTMELIEGETLYRRLRRDGPLDVAAAQPIVTGILAGLGACHKLGIVHRDFKSANIMLSQNGADGMRAVITDFGLAHTLAGGEHEPAVSVGGAIMGTPGYMSPEQKQGKTATAASDIYALGIVLFEMLTGRRPDRDAGSIIWPKDGEFAEERWKTVILRCTRTNPAERYSSADEIVQALATDTGRVSEVPHEVRTRRRALGLALAALVTLLIGVAAWYGYKKSHALPEQKHVAILPFLSLSSSAADQVFCEGLAETLTSKLSQLERFQKSFWVVPAADTRKVKEPQDAYRKLSATLVVSGTLQRFPGKTVLVINVIDPRTHRQLASRDIETPTGNLSDLDDEAWQHVADLLDLQLRPEQVRALESGRARVPGAYVLYAQGLGYLRRNGLGNIDNAISRFGEAIRLDPTYALPYSSLGSAYALKYEVTVDTKWLEPARANAKMAVQLAPELAATHFTLGQLDYSSGLNEEAERELTRALALDPDVIEAHFYLGRVHNDEGKLAAAERDFRAAVTRRPEYWRAHSELGSYYYRRGRLKEAEHEFLEALKWEPDQTGPLTNLGAMYMAAGRLTEAVQVFENQVRVNPDDADAFSNLGTALIYLGRYAAAVAPMERAAKLRPGFTDLWRNLGDAYAMVSDQADKAADAYREGLKMGRRQLAVNPNDWETAATVALLEAHLKNKSAALTLAELAAKKAPSNNEILFSLALVHEILGQRSSALRALRTAYERGYSLNYIERDPILTQLRRDESFLDWLQQVKTNLTQH